MIEIKDFNQYPFVREAKSKSFQKRAIYRYSSFSEVFYLVTPNYGNVDKVKSIDEIVTLIRQHKMVQYKKSSNIYEAINIAWENWDEDWEWNGTLYSANASKDIEEAPYHEVLGGLCRIGYYHGNMVWVYMKPNGHVRYCRFFRIDVQPDWSKGGWTNKRNIHPIFNTATGRYI